MNISEAISLFEERCESQIDFAALECIRAALGEVQKPAVPCGAAKLFNGQYCPVYKGKMCIGVPCLITALRQ